VVVGLELGVVPQMKDSLPCQFSLVSRTEKCGQPSNLAFEFKLGGGSG